jgi:ubiquinone/menaquinone biosynthesis C-methylase UbiE
MSHFDIWNRYMQSYDFLKHVDSYSQNLLDIAAAAKAGAGTRVLDAGSGTGNLSMILKGCGANVTSCDFSPNALAVHRTKDPNAKLVETSLENPLPFANGAFDCVCCASVLFTLSQAGCGSTVREFNRVLKHKGTLVVTVPAPNQQNHNLISLHFQGLMQRHGKLKGIVSGIFDLPALFRILHYGRELSRLPDWQGWHRFTAEELGELARSSGFEQIRLTTHMAVASFCWLPKRATMRKFQWN